MADDLRTLIAAAPGPDDARAAMLAFLDDHTDALMRTCLAGHFTASAAIVDPSRDAALVVFHRKLQRWLQPGGHADGDADLARVARREAKEETGIIGLRLVGGPIDLDVHEIPARLDEPAHLHLDVRFLVVTPPGAEPTLNHESEAFRWLTAAELDDPLLDASTRRLLRAALSQ